MRGHQEVRARAAPRRFSLAAPLRERLAAPAKGGGTADRAGAEASGKLHACEGSEGGANSSAEFVLRPWLQELGLRDRLNDTSWWLDHQDACNLEEVGDPIDHVEGEGVCTITREGDCSADGWAPRVRHRALRGGYVRSARSRMDTPPKYRCRVNPILLRARIPTPAELGAAEAARQSGGEAAQPACREAPGADDGNALDPLGTFEGMREAFERVHGEEIRSELGPRVRLVPAKISDAVQDRFLSRCRATGAIPDFGYHGTRRRKFPSVFRRGLLVPGPRSVPVLHGSEHGVGIYTAMPGAAWLSRIFCDSPDMLVCGVVTQLAPERARKAAALPARSRPMPCQWLRGRAANRNHHRPAPAPKAAPKVATGAPRRIGHLSVGRDDHVIREDVGIRVVFDSSYVAPLFVAQGAGRQEVEEVAADYCPYRVWGPGGNANRRRRGQPSFRPGNRAARLPPARALPRLERAAGQAHVRG
uniref:PARP catalytic domain-containing protein n=1 Tax=Zooxanthella nutricula TaxID=1333877 RepID=A0A6U6HQ36_9DINO|mmetsp:Transcript_12732/g.37924  ORF Transcript_12732/g.37924 Transcript_12732/m.37924 type:complete len:475 (+) Transcript_12732:84-1508(+)